MNKYLLTTGETKILTKEQLDVISYPISYEEAIELI